MKTKEIYLLSSSEYPEETNFKQCADSIDGIKKLVIETVLDDYGWVVIPESIFVSMGNKVIHFDYKWDDTDDYVENKKYYFHIIPVLETE